VKLTTHLRRMPSLNMLKAIAYLCSTFLFIACCLFSLGRYVYLRISLQFHSSWFTLLYFTVLTPALFYLLVHSRCLGFLWFRFITIKHTPQSVGLLWTRDRPVAETSTWQHKHCRRQISTPPVGFEPKSPASARPQTYSLDRAVTGIGCSWFHNPNNLAREANCEATRQWIFLYIRVYASKILQNKIVRKFLTVFALSKMFELTPGILSDVSNFVY
jgi:hypothetical protein